jgi:hypothetical protein
MQSRMSSPVSIRQPGDRESTHENYASIVSDAAGTLAYLYKKDTPPQASVAQEITDAIHELRIIGPKLRDVGRLVTVADRGRPAINVAVNEADAVLPALKPIINAIFDAAGDTYKDSFEAVCRQLDARVRRENDQALVPCLIFFRGYLQHLELVLTGARPEVSLIFTKRLEDLLQAQKYNIKQAPRQPTTAAQASGMFCMLTHVTTIGAQI